MAINFPDQYQHGTQDEKSDIRIHVCPQAHKMYVFKTADAVRALAENKTRKKAFQDGVTYATGDGLPINPLDIAGVRIVLVYPHDVVKFDAAWDTSRRGRFGEELVMRYLREGRIPLPFSGDIQTNPTVQKDGKDIIVQGTFRVQVKCESYGGIGYGASGHVYLQTSELNPLRRI